MSFATQPVDVVVGRRLPEPITVQIVDEADRGWQSDEPVELSLDGTAEATLAAMSGGDAPFGVTSFNDLSINRAGRYRLVARWNGLEARSEEFVVVSAPDLIRVHNTSGSMKGVVVDGATSREFVPDYPIVTTDSVIEVIRQGVGRNGEVVAFDRLRPPAAVEARWTTGVDTVDIVLRSVPTIDIHVWVMTGGFDVLKLGEVFDELKFIWHHEGIGVEAEFIVVDHSDDLEAGLVSASDLCRTGSTARERWGFEEERINVYYVQANNAFACAPQVVVINPRLARIPGVLVHELGHLLGLPHPQQYDLNGFDSGCNAMGGSGLGICPTVDAFLTEGQIFHAHHQMTSALVRLYGLTPQGRDCNPPRNSERDRPRCMLHSLRLMEDGDWGPSAPWGG